MNRQRLSFVVTIATFVAAVFATAAPADAQLFRRLRAARQSAAQSQYRQQRNQAYQQSQTQQAQSRRDLRTPARSNNPLNARPGVSSARYPQVLGPVSSQTQNPSRIPTLADPPKRVTDNLELSQEGGTDGDRGARNEGAQSVGLGQSILSRDDSNNEEPVSSIQSPAAKNATAKQAMPTSAASMGLEVYQFPTPQIGVRIASINEQSQADESGLRVGDTIVAIDRTRTVAPKDVAAVLRNRQPGSSLRVQFVRDNIAYVTDVPLIASEFSGTIASGKTSRDLQNKAQANDDRVTVAKPPILGSEPQHGQSQSKKIKLGMLIQDSASLRGTVVTMVRPNSIADASDLKEGDRIVSVESRLLENGHQLREIVSGMTRGDQLAVGIVRDGELISRKINFAEPTPANVAASKPKAIENKGSASNLGKGLGSMLGGLFGGGSKPKKQDPVIDEQVIDKQAIDEQVVNAGGTMPQAAESASTEADPLDFDDGEPIEQVIFQKKNDRVNKELQISRDPPSLALPNYKIPEKSLEKQQQDNLKKADAQRIREEIQRLKRELESIESLDNE